MITSATVTHTASLVSAGKPRRWVHAANRSDATIYVKYDGDGAELTAENGIPIAPGEMFRLRNHRADQEFWHDIFAVHGEGEGEEKILVIHEA